MSASRHVVHVLSSLGMGGQERVALDLAVGQVRRGFRVTAISLAPPPEGPLAAEFRRAGAEVTCVPRSGEGFDLLLPLRLARRLRRDRTDLVHTHNRMALLYGAPAGRLARAAVVHTKHGRNPGSRTQVRVARLAARFVDAFVAVSAETAAFARERREVPEARLSTIANGIALDRFHPDAAARDRLREQLRIPADAWVMGTVGRLAPEKNQALLLRAAAPLLSGSCRLVLVGDGPLRPALEALATELGIRSLTHFLGAREDVPEVLSALDAFALTSDSEGLPLAIPEAMATGLPVVATAVGGVPLVLADGETGYLVPPRAEELLRQRLGALRDDRAAAAACGARARAAALERFSAERMIEEYLALYRRTWARRGR